MKDFHKELITLTASGLCRQLHSFTAIDAAHVSENGQTYLMLASNNYLGLTHDVTVQEAAAQAVWRYGTGSGGSRLTTGNHSLYNQLEKELASFKGAEAALVFNTGYMANIGIISALTSPDDVIFSDALNHASIIDGCRLSQAQTVVYRHADSCHLAELLATIPCRGQRIIVTDGVFSMDGDIAPLPDLVRLAEQYGALVMVDDAHATGVIGPGGKGTAAHFGLVGKVHLSMGTLSKAFAAEGGFVAGKQVFIDYLINKARSFIFSTALAPSTIAAGLAALGTLRRNPELVEQLNCNAQAVRTELAAAGFDLCGSETAIIPILVGQAETALTFARLLKEEGLLLSAIRYPTVPQGASRLRLTVTAAHSDVELQRAVQTIIQVGKKIAII